MWKYAASKGVNGTPTAYINGVMLDSEPMAVETWLEYLQQVYDSQYH
jgi:protein-disulfide isomerase